MITVLPTVEELEKLPMRALVSFAARTARRVSSEFRGIIADDILDNALRYIDSVSTAHVLDEVDPASVIRASERVVSAYEAAPAGMKSIEKIRLLFSFVHAALSAMYAILAAHNPSNSRHQLKHAAQVVQRAVGPLESLNSEAAKVMIQAARRDYEILLQKYGKYDKGVIGDPVDCFDDGGKGK